VHADSGVARCPVTRNRRHRWTEAVWESDLTPAERLVCLVFADHSRQGDTFGVWVTLDRLQQRTGYSRDTVNRVLGQLRDAGWLTVTEKAKQHRATRYALTIPTSQQSDDRTPEQSDSRTADEIQQSDPAPQQSDGAVPAVRSSDSIHVLSMSNDHSRARERCALGCDSGWINNDDNTVSPCPACRKHRNDLTQQLSEIFGCKIEADYAQKLRDSILAGRSVKDPTKYVLTAVRRDPSRYRPAERAWRPTRDDTWFVNDPDQPWNSSQESA